MELKGERKERGDRSKRKKGKELTERQKGCYVPDAALSLNSVTRKVKIKGSREKK